MLVHWDALAGGRYVGARRKVPSSVTHLVREDTDESLCGAGAPGAWIETDTRSPRCVKCLSRARNASVTVVVSMNVDDGIPAPENDLPATEQG